MKRLYYIATLAIALFASGQSSTFTGTIAGQVILEGFLDLKIPCWQRRLITRGLAEMTRLGVALGARPDTFMGLSGLGDLVLTATGDLSRNRRVGMLLAQGHTLAQAVESLGHVAEGVYCARTVAQRAQALGVDMPITRAVVALLDGRLSPPEAVATLMGRDPATEFADRG